MSEVLQPHKFSYISSDILREKKPLCILTQTCIQKNIYYGKKNQQILPFKDMSTKRYSIKTGYLNLDLDHINSCQKKFLPRLLYPLKNQNDIL
jgi:hypothetical protein